MLADIQDRFQKQSFLCQYDDKTCEIATRFYLDVVHIVMHLLNTCYGNYCRNLAKIAPPMTHYHPL